MNLPRIQGFIEKLNTSINIMIKPLLEFLCIVCLHIEYYIAIVPSNQLVKLSRRTIMFKNVS